MFYNLFVFLYLVTTLLPNPNNETVHLKKETFKGLVLQRVPMPRRAAQGRCSANIHSTNDRLPAPAPTSQEDRSQADVYLTRPYALTTGLQSPLTFLSSWALIVLLSSSICISFRFLLSLLWDPLLPERQRSPPRYKILDADRQLCNR